ncbi:nucleotidyltransferase family protein [Engelhardtia mirabilis]|uniref:Nucleotidyltransferase domain protein n=1 Tax=Engelhardtia mirabilis TaxID=2528011 RepID=A0A518BE84_9BACT|nr:Nucleotidyltransferase domain protein [Planctomycetes bacterium Pla133]QDU99623.1 Nucleotidyltransferase domain protein [Planctomycetes bacterium Pla86]
MIDLLSKRLEEVRALCRRHRLRRLDLFGSAATGRFDPASSDLDFIVEFEDEDPVARADAFFGLLADLEDLFERRIDLVVESAVTNPYLRDEIDETRQPLFAA